MDTFLVLKGERRGSQRQGFGSSPDTTAQMGAELSLLTSPCYKQLSYSRPGRDDPPNEFTFSERKKQGLEKAYPHLD
jgi:hypothetical protein